MKKRSPKDHPKIIIQEEGDENADWLKHLDGGRFQRDDLEAHDQALEAHREEERKKRGGEND